MTDISQPITTAPVYLYLEDGIDAALKAGKLTSIAIKQSSGF